MTAIDCCTVGLSFVVTGFGLSSQVYKNYKRKSVEGLSTFYFSMLVISYCFWIAHGAVNHDWVVVVPMSIGATVSFAIVCQMIRYGFCRKGS